MMRFNRSECGDIDFARSREWLISNGIGGYASSTICGMNTRRYHGLLVAATKPPLGRMVLLSKLEESIFVHGQRFPLSTNFYRGDVIYPNGFSQLTGFELDPDPISIYGNDAWQLTKKISMTKGRNETVIEYVLRGDFDKDVVLELSPLIAFRDYHGTTHENNTLSSEIERAYGAIVIQPYKSLPELYFSYSSGEIAANGTWYRDFLYEWERRRGLDDLEDLFNPFQFKVPLANDRTFTLRVGTERRPVARSVAVTTSAAPSSSETTATLEHAANQFVVDRAPFKTILAGYHWFEDWGRDTMIALPGLLLARGKHEEAKQILLQFSRFLDQGMLPNRFIDAGEQPEYNTVDATLWFVESIRQYLLEGSFSADSVAAALRYDFYEPLLEIVRWHLNGTRFGIKADENGFLWCGDKNTQLTWMDARVDGIAVTPRHGRPVEIQALWYNALETIVEFAVLLGDLTTQQKLSNLAVRLRTHFSDVFWNNSEECLYDVVREEECDASIRPNQLLAVSLHFPLLSGEKAQKTVATVERELLTPYGVRTLSPKDPQYIGRYAGGVASRDGAYHQGTVWPWLIGPFFAAKRAVGKSAQEVDAVIKQWLDGFLPHLKEEGLGQISEVFDGDAPHSPNGCIAQAWSVAEVLKLVKGMT